MVPRGGGTQCASCPGRRGTAGPWGAEAFGRRAAVRQRGSRQPGARATHSVWEGCAAGEAGGRGKGRPRARAMHSAQRRGRGSCHGGRACTGRGAAALGRAGWGQAGRPGASCRGETVVYQTPGGGSRRTTPEAHLRTAAPRQRARPRIGAGRGMGAGGPRVEAGAHHWGWACHIACRGPRPRGLHMNLFSEGTGLTRTRHRRAWRGRQAGSTATPGPGAGARGRRTRHGRLRPRAAPAFSPHIGNRIAQKQNKKRMWGRPHCAQVLEGGGAAGGGRPGHRRSASRG